jgi:hypothetical protein
MKFMLEATEDVLVLSACRVTKNMAFNATKISMYSASSGNQNTLVQFS